MNHEQDPDVSTLLGITFELVPEPHYISNCEIISNLNSKDYLKELKNIKINKCSSVVNLTEDTIIFDMELLTSNNKELDLTEMGLDLQSAKNLGGGKVSFKILDEQKLFLTCIKEGVCDFSKISA